MKDEEKKIIENLFHRLKKTELNSSERDEKANSLIQDLVKKQPYSSYYMTQTMLIQEAAIKKLSLKVEELTNKISSLNQSEKNKKTSFLSNFFRKEPHSSELSNNNIWQKNQNIPGSSIPISQQPLNNNGGGFLKNALQTATGVAGGMILGNMLMNVFNHSKPEEEIFDTINHSSTEEQIFHENNLINYDDNNDFHTDDNISDFNNDHINEITDENNIIDVNDDNFI